MLSVYIFPKDLQRITSTLKSERRVIHTPFIAKPACYDHSFALSKYRTK